jgi:hypothetical protein
VITGGEGGGGGVHTADSGQVPVQAKTGLFNKTAFDHTSTASNFDKSWLSVLIFFEADVMVGTRRLGKGQNMEINKKLRLFEMCTNTSSAQT